MAAYGSLAEIYDRFTYDVDYKAFADFYEARFKERAVKPKTILDAGCGTGSLTMIMAMLGYELISVDASADMLSIAQEKCAEARLSASPLFLCQELGELDLYGTVDSAISSLDCVNYLPEERIPEFFRRLHLFIEPGGLFIFDINSPERLKSLDGFTSVDEDEDNLCLWRADFDEEENALVYGIDIFTRRGRFWQRSSEEHIEYAHAPETLSALLQNAGFSDIEICSSGPQGELGRLFVIAKNTPHAQ